MLAEVTWSGVLGATRGRRSHANEDHYWGVGLGAWHKMAQAERKRSASELVK